MARAVTRRCRTRRFAACQPLTTARTTPTVASLSAENAKSAALRQLVGVLRRRKTGFQARIQQQIASASASSSTNASSNPGASPSRRHRLNSEPPNDASTEITSPQRQPLHSRGHWWRRPLSKTPAPPAGRAACRTKSVGYPDKTAPASFRPAHAKRRPSRTAAVRACSISTAQNPSGSRSAPCWS